MRSITRPVLFRYLKTYMEKQGARHLELKAASPELREALRAATRTGAISLLGIMDGKQTIFTLNAQRFLDASAVIVTSQPDNNLSAAQEVFLADSAGCHYQRIDGEDISPSITVPWSNIFHPAAKH